MMRHIGVKLHKTNFVAGFLAADDTQSIETYPLNRDGLARSRRRLRQSDELAVEATQNVYHFYDQVKGHVSRVRVVDTYRFGVIAKSKKKTDKADIAVLAMVNRTKTRLMEFYRRKRREKGTGKAICATARKLLTIIFVLLKKELDY